jgi:hypothetical protein
MGAFDENQLSEALHEKLAADPAPILFASK